jgi:hypothetical protein
MDVRGNGDTMSMIYTSLIICVIINFFDIINHLVFCFKHDLSEAESSLKTYWQTELIHYLWNSEKAFGGLINNLNNNHAKESDIVISTA